MMRIVVDLPAPFGPRKPVTRPGSATKDTSSTAVKPPYVLVTPSTVIMRRASSRHAAAAHRPQGSRTADQSRGRARPRALRPRARAAPSAERRAGPTPEQYNPPLTWRSHAWRIAAVLSHQRGAVAGDRARCSGERPGRCSGSTSSFGLVVAACCPSSGGAGRSRSRRSPRLLGSVSVIVRRPGRAGVGLPGHPPGALADRASSAAGIVLVGRWSTSLRAAARPTTRGGSTFAFGLAVHDRDAGLGHVPRLATRAAVDAARPGRAGRGRAGSCASSRAGRTSAPGSPGRCTTCWPTGSA